MYFLNIFFFPQRKYVAMVLSAILINYTHPIPGGVNSGKGSGRLR